jgi:transcriptional regulator with XRE-family HTH domain
MLTVKGGQLMDQIKVGAFLKTLRKEKKLTQEQLAEQLNVSGRTVSRWETGNNMPDISLLVEIADFYDISIPELIDGERKSEKMNEEIKEVADKMADYAGEEKATIIKNIRNNSLFGVGAIVMLLILELFAPDGFSKATDLIRLYCKTLVYVSTLMVFFISTGLLYKFKKQKRESDLPKPVQYSIMAVVAFAVAAAIKFLLKIILGL